jgi:hypothetical protein
MARRSRLADRSDRQCAMAPFSHFAQSLAFGRIQPVPKFQGQESLRPKKSTVLH